MSPGFLGLLHFTLPSARLESMAELTTIQLPIPWETFGLPPELQVGSTCLIDGPPAWAWDGPGPEIGIPFVATRRGDKAEGWGLDHVVVLVPDLELARRQFVAKLGAPRLNTTVNGRPTAFYRVGATARSDPVAGASPRSLWAGARYDTCRSPRLFSTGGHADSMSPIPDQRFNQADVSSPSRERRRGWRSCRRTVRREKRHRTLLDPEDQLTQPDPARLESFEIDLHRPETESPHLVTKAGCHPHHTVIMFESTKPQTCASLVQDANQHPLQPGQIEGLGKGRSKYGRVNAPALQIRFKCPPERLNQTPTLLEWSHQLQTWGWF